MNTSKALAFVTGALLFLAACDGTPLPPPGTGGAAGEGGTGGAAGGIGGGEAGHGGTGGVEPTGGTGGADVDPDGDPFVNGLPATLDTIAEHDCVAYTPTDEEDGAYARVVFGPVPKAWTTRSLRFLAMRGDNYMVPKSWHVAWHVVSPGEDPSAVKCLSAAIDVKELGFTTLTNGDEVVHLEVAYLPTVHEPGATLVACLKHTRNVLGFGKSTGLLMCGAPGSCTAADQWEQNGAAEPLAQHAPPDTCRHWMMQFHEAECDGCYVGDKCMPTSYATCGAPGMYCQACPDPGPCNVGSCEEGACAATPANEGAVCGDGQTCQSGACK